HCPPTSPLFPYTTLFRSPVGFFQVGRYFRQKFIMGHAGGGSKPGFFFYEPADFYCNEGSRRQADMVFSDVQVGFIQRKGFDQVAELKKDLSYLIGNLPVHFKSRLYKHSMWTALHGLCR